MSGRWLPPPPPVPPPGRFPAGPAPVRVKVLHLITRFEAGAGGNTLLSATGMDPRRYEVWIAGGPDGPLWERAEREGAREITATVAGPAAGPTATKIAVAVACVGAAGVPATQALRGEAETSRPAAHVTSATRAPAPDVREQRPAGADRPARSRAARAARPRAVAEASRRAERRGASDAVMTVPAAGPAGATTVRADSSAPGAAATSAPERLRETVDRVRKVARDVPERVAGTVPAVRRVTAGAVREVERVSASVTTTVGGVSVSDLSEPLQTVEELLG